MQKQKATQSYHAMITSTSKKRKGKFTLTTILDFASVRESIDFELEMENLVQKLLTYLRTPSSYTNLIDTFLGIKQQMEQISSSSHIILSYDGEAGATAEEK